MFKHYLISAIRNVTRHRAVSAINVGGLAVGLACCLLILLYLKSELSFDSFHHDKENIYQLVCKRTEQDGKSERFGIAALVQGPAFKQEIPEIREYVRVFPRDMVIKKGGDLFNEEVTWADPAFFKVFNFRVLSGDPSRMLAGTHDMVLSESAAVKYFGTRDAVGKQLLLQTGGKFEPFVVRGVLQDAPGNSSMRYHILLSFPYYEALNPDNGWMWVSFPTYFLLTPGANTVTVARKMQQVYQEKAKEEIDLNRLAGYGNGFEWDIRPMTAMHLQNDYEETPYATNPVYAYILSGIALFILVIAGINFVNLSIARAVRRSREIGVRKASGSKRLQLILQFLCESMFLSLMAFLLAIVLAVVALPKFSELADTRLSLSWLADWRLLAEMAGLFLLTGLAAGFYPAMILSGFNPVEALAGKAGMRGSSGLSKALIIVQFTSATVLIIAMLFMYAQFNLLTRTDLGYNDKDLLSFTVSGGVKNKPLMDYYKSVLGLVPGVKQTSYQNIGIFGGKTIINNKELTATYVRVDDDYPQALGVPLVAGRALSKAFPSDSVSSALVNETLVKEAGLTNAVGKTLDYMNIPGWGARKLTIAGVLRDFHYGSLKEKIPPMVFLQDNSLPLGKMWVRLNHNQVPQTLIAIGKACQGLNPDRPFLYEFAEDANRRAYEPEDRWKSIITFGAAVSVLVALTGLFGLAMISVRKRKKEIGIRKVVGASTQQLALLIARDFGRLILISFVIAIPLAIWTLVRWLQSYPYRVDLAWWRFLTAGLIVFIVAMLTVSYHVLRTALANPAESLKNE